MTIDYTSEQLITMYQNETEELFDRYHSGRSQNKTQNILDIKFKIIAYKHMVTESYYFILRGIYNSWNAGTRIENPSDELYEKARIMFGDN